jgi:tetratricopeptide (TPR) repeat protein
LFQHGLALKALMDERRFELLEQAGSALMAAGDTDGAAEVEVSLAEMWWHARERGRCSACLERAADLVRGSDASVTSALVLAQIARFYALFGNAQPAIELARRSLGLAEALARDDVRATNLITLGTAGLYVRNPDIEAALADLRTGIDLASAYGDLFEASRGYSNLGALLQYTGDLPGAEEATFEAYRITERIGHVPGMRFSAGNMIEIELYTGKWLSVERRANAFLEESERGSSHYQDISALHARSIVELAGDKIELAREDIDRAIAAGRKVMDPQAKNPALAMGAFVYAELDEYERARALLEEFESGPFVAATPTAFFAASKLGVTVEFRQRVQPFARETRFERAAEAVLDGRWVEAADAYDEIGARPFAALAALRAAEALVEQGRRAEADEQLLRALAFFRSVGATRYVREGESLLAASA